MGQNRLSLDIVVDLTSSPQVLLMGASEIFFMHGLHLIMKSGSHAPRPMLIVVLGCSTDFGTDKLVEQKSHSRIDSILSEGRMLRKLYTSGLFPSRKEQIQAVLPVAEYALIFASFCSHNHYFKACWN